MSNIFGGGSNLPPGCSVNDIPGNTPEDAYWEGIELTFWEDKKNCPDVLWKKFEKAELSDPLMEIVVKAIMFGVEIGTKQERDNQHDNTVYDKNTWKTFYQALHEIERLSMVTGYSGEAHFEVLRQIKQSIKNLNGET